MRFIETLQALFARGLKLSLAKGIKLSWTWTLPTFSKPNTEVKEYGVNRQAETSVSSPPASDGLNSGSQEREGGMENMDVLAQRPCDGGGTDSGSTGNHPRYG